MLRFREMSNEQRRQFVDVGQTFTAWREASKQFGHSYEGSYRAGMRWVKRNGADYLLRKYRKTERSLGPRSPETEKIQEKYMRERSRIRRRLTQTKARLDSMRRVNVALRLNRVPIEAAKVIRALDEADLLGRHVFVVGTNAMYAYEARAGILFGVDRISTQDLDVLLDARRRLTLAFSDDVRCEGIMGILRKADKTYDTGRMYGYSATNDDGYIVDLICPEEGPVLSAPSKRLGEDFNDLEPAPIEGLQWLINAPKIEEIAIGEDGMPLHLACIDPRVFALHKKWLSLQVTRQPIKKKRDAEQAVAVAALCQSYFNLGFDTKELSALPSSIRDLRKELSEQAAGFLEVEDSDIDQRGW